MNQIDDVSAKQHSHSKTDGQTQDRPEQAGPQLVQMLAKAHRRVMKRIAAKIVGGRRSGSASCHIGGMITAVGKPGVGGSRGAGASRRDPFDSRSNSCWFQSMQPAIARSIGKKMVELIETLRGFLTVDVGRENQAKRPILSNLGAFGSVTPLFFARRALAQRGRTAVRPPRRLCHDFAMTLAPSFRSHPPSRRLIAGVPPASKVDRWIKGSVALCARGARWPKALAVVPGSLADRSQSR